ncbi:MAG: glycosyltransferase family 4 protein [Planctomycetota bacterium]
MKRLLIVRAGDYAEAWNRFRSGEAASFRDQQLSVDFVESLSGRYDVTTLARCERVHDEALLPRLRSVGVTSATFYDAKAITEVLERLAPDLMILTMAATHVVRWAAKRKLDVLPMFADLFAPKGPRGRYRTWKLRRALRSLRYPCVANHSLEASKSLRALGIPDERIVPWEHSTLSAVSEAKSAPTGREFRLLYVGRLIASKGVGEAIDAVAALQVRGAPLRLTIVGEGQRGLFVRQVARLGVEKRVDFRGQVSSGTVLEWMRSHDAVVVPSRHEYPEGLPNTIFEALASRTPLIASDHPAFAPRLSPGRDSLRFRAGDAGDLAVQVARLRGDPDLYRRLSRNSAATLSSLYVGLHFTELMRAFLRDPVDTERWVADCSLAAVLRG